jgi:hypothetical protein
MRRASEIELGYPVGTSGRLRPQHATQSRLALEWADGWEDTATALSTAAADSAVNRRFFIWDPSGRLDRNL